MPLSEPHSEIRSSLFNPALHETLEAVILVNAHGMVLDWDSHAETMFGWTRTEIIGQMLEIIFESDTLTPLRSEIERLELIPKELMNSVSERHHIVRGRQRTGATFAVEASLQRLSLTESSSATNTAPNLSNYCLFVRDIEKFKDVYAELRKRERRYRILSYFSASVFGNDSIDAVLWDIAKNCIVELDFEDAVVYWLDTEQQLLVQKAAFGLGKEWNDTVLQPMDIRLGQGIVGCVAESGISERIRDTSQDPRYIVDDAVRSSELAVPIVYKGTVLGVIDSEHSQRDFFTEEDAHIVEQMAAIAATKIVRIQAEESVREMKAGLEQLVAQRTEELSLANEEIRRQVEILAHQTQEIEFSNVALQEKNEQLSTLNAELDAAVRFKTQVLSIAAHDLKNPLSVILTSAELAQSELTHAKSTFGETPFVSASLGFLHKIAHTSRYMLKLITNLLDAAAIDIGQIQFHQKALNPAPILAAALDNFETHARTKQQTITLYCAADTRVFADEERLYQVFENLISNAVKYSPAGATIDVRLVQPTDAGIVRIEVHDEGPGFSNDDKTKLFGFFQRLSARPTGGEPSNGVGLAIVKKIVDAHGGTIRVESRTQNTRAQSSIHAGSVFIVELPEAGGDTAKNHHKPEV